MTRIAVAGAAGRMGSRIVALSKEYPVKIVGAFERKGHKDIGKDVGLLAGAGELGIKLHDDIEAVIGDASVVIDFTSSSVAVKHLRAASARGRAMVIGTTGLSKDDMAEISALAAKVPCVLSSNMSLGVNLLLKVIADVAKALGDDYDVEIIEAHHRHKKDAPSGTALRMGEAIAKALGRDLQEAGVYARKGMIGERSKKEIGIQTVRAGDIVGEHTVLFGGLGERIEITHRASSRDTFARGALKAALWLEGKAPGLYDMQDVLGLKK